MKVMRWLSGSGVEESALEPSPITGLAMRQVSRRGALKSLGAIGLTVVLAGVSLNAQAQEADAVGCHECTGPCSGCSSSCHSPDCSDSCVCECNGTCYMCNPTYARAHLLYILGFIPNCTCESCTP
jgi:hypothetical protein